jgi:PAS domain S-box-containing protein
MAAAAATKAALAAASGDPLDAEVSGALTRLLLETVGFIAGILDLRGRVLALSPVTLRHTGLELSDLMGRQFWRVPIWRAPEDAETVRRLVEAGMAGRPARGELELAPAHGGSLFEIELEVRPIRDSSGAVAFLLAQVAPRLTPFQAPEPVRSDAAAVARQVAELVELRQRLLADVTHDMRAPLLAIIRASERMLADGVARDDAEEMRSCALTVLEQLEELRDLAGIEHRRTAVRLQELDVAAELRALARRFRSTAAARGQELTVEAPKALRVATDGDKLTRIAANLVSNAIACTPPGGRVRIALEAQPGAITVSVADSGPGIAPEDRRRVWERSWRGAAARLNRADGEGLGLAIVREAVELLQGSAEIADAPEGGALVRVRIPAHDVTAAGRPPSLHEQSRRALITESAAAALQLGTFDSA